MIFQQHFGKVSIVKRIFQYLILIGFSMVFAKVFLYLLPDNRWGYFHVLIEATCILIAFSIFFIIWHTYEDNDLSTNIFGFGFLISAFLTIFHILYSETLVGATKGYIDIAGKFWIIARFVEAFTFIFGTFRYKLQPKINKWLLLVMTVTFSLATSYFILEFPQYFPEVRNQTGVTIFKLALEVIVIVLFMMGLYNLKREINLKNKISYSYILLALLVAVPTEFCFAVLVSLKSFLFSLGHILKLTYYFFLYKGIVVNILNYPIQKISAADKYHQGILNGLPLGIITFDKNMTLNFANKEAQRLLDCGEDVYGSSAQEVACSLFNVGEHPTKVSAPSGSIPHNSIKEITTEEGNKVKVKMDVQKLENGEMMCLLSDAKKEQEVQNLQLQTQTILNAIDNPVVITDVNGKIVMHNSAFVECIEIQPEKLVNTDKKDFIRLITDEKKSLKNIYSSNNKRNFEASFTTPSGKKKELLIHISPVLNVDGDIIGRVGIASDITSLKIEQSKLQQQEKLALLGQMAAGIVHEIRNPLTTIRGFSQMIKTKTKEEIIREYATVIEDATTDANKVVSDFLAFAKPHPPIFKKVDINDIVLSMNLMLDSHSFLEGVEISLNLASNKRMVLVDEAQIRQVILNIVKNAIDAMSDIKHPHLEIKTGYKSNLNEAYIVISDNGKGMQLEDKIKVGSPFFTTKDKGTGLGLSICYQIINEHGGRIEFDSELGKGTAFTINLPCVD